MVLAHLQFMLGFNYYTMIYKKSILVLGIIFLIGIVLTGYSEFTSADEIFYCYETDICVQLDVQLNQQMVNFILNYVAVIDVETEQDLTLIRINESIWDYEQVSNFRDNIEKWEWSVKENEARQYLYPDDKPAPICVRDTETGIPVGLYINSSYSNTLLYPVLNDVRCP